MFDAFEADSSAYLFTFEFMPRYLSPKSF
jgi:hypothetical protein